MAGSFAAVGSCETTSTVSRRFIKLVELAKVRRIRFHDLRLTHASIAITSGEHIKAVSARPGHSDIGFTLRQYTHLMPEHQGLPADGVIASLFGSEPAYDQSGARMPRKRKEPLRRGALTCTAMVAGGGFEPPTFGL